MRPATIRWLLVVFCFVLAGGVAGLAIRYPVVWSAMEWLAIGLGSAIAISMWWISRGAPTAEAPELRALAPEQRRGMRRDLLVAFGIAFASLVGLVAAIRLVGSRLQDQIPSWLVMLAVTAWVGATLALAAPLIGRVSSALLSRIKIGGEGGEQNGGQDG